MEFERQAIIFRALGNPIRIQILTLLVRGPLCVSDIIRCTRHRQAYISQQLMFLRSKGLVESHKEGWNVCYQLVDTAECRWLKHLIEEVCLRTETT